MDCSGDEGWASAELTGRMRGALVEIKIQL
jgi:hypothetical protein